MEISQRKRSMWLQWQPEDSAWSQCGAFTNLPLKVVGLGQETGVRLSLMVEVKILIRAEFWGRRRESQAKFSWEDENITYQKEQARASGTG